MTDSNPKDNKQDQGSYSMYPPTSPVAPPANMQYNINMYGNPAAAAAFAQYGYGYPMPMDVYAGQGAPFMGYGMNPNMMYYGNGNGNVPQQNPKKKYYNNNSNNINNNNNTNSIGSNTSNNISNISTPLNNSKTATSSVTSTGTSTPVSKPVSIVIKNQYKFELGNSNSFSTKNLKLEYPFYVNTDEVEFEQARSKRHFLRLQALNDEISTPTADVEAEIDEATVPLDEGIVEDGPKNEKTSKESSKEDSSEAPSPKSVKSWSAIASSAVSKPKVSSSPTPQLKKDKKYVPSTIKSLEPLGVVALRMCLDQDYIKYTIENVPDAGKAIDSIVPRGIVNTGNICFMSSVLQVLLYCKPFINILNVISYRTVAKIGSSVSPSLDACLELYRRFDKQTCENEKKPVPKSKLTNGNNVGITPAAEPIKPDDFYKTLSKLPKFRDLRWGHQEDAEEFLTHLLDQLHEEFITSIDALNESDIMNLLQTINDEDLKGFFVRSLSKYKTANFAKNCSAQMKGVMDKYGSNGEDDEEDCENGWHEVSSTSRKGKKTKSAAKRTVEVEVSPISSIFGGQFRSVLDIPKNKESQSITLDPFQTIQLDISDPAVNDLETAFKKFSEYELIPFKSSSGNDVEAKKQTFIDKLPQVLLIQLKRFSFINNTDKDKIVNYNAYSGRVEKIRKKIHYNHELTIPRETISSVHANFYNDAGTKYKLVGVVYHHGVSPSGGHYTADVYHQEMDKWFRIDDVNIAELNKEEVLKGGEDGFDSRTAYILMYQKI